MCQLTAIIPTRELTEEEKKLQAFIMSELLLTNSKSGNRDGVGIANVEGAFTWEQSAQNVVPWDTFQEELSSIIGGPIIGHVRATSTGAKAKQGAHPFVEGSLILAHNGTFRNYKKLPAFETFDKDDDPVDSHVVCREMFQRMKEKESNLTKEIIKEVAQDADGSYAMLIFDATLGTLWVVRGSCQLSTGYIGPLRIVNTSATNLDGVLKTARMVAKTVLGIKEIELEESSTITVRTINRVEDGEIKKVDDIPYNVTMKPKNRSNYYAGYTSPNWEKACTTEEARGLADKLADTTKQTGLCFHTIEWASRYVFDRDWFTLTIEETEALADALKKLFEENYTTEKGRLWTDVWMNLSPRYPHEALDDQEIENKFPYVLHTEEELKAMIELTDKETV